MTDLLRRLSGWLSGSPRATWSPRRKAKCVPVRWTVEVPDDGPRVFYGGVFTARTKSEARALAKREFGLSRLPVGTVVARFRP